mgnify:CR=1 FL=1
MLLITGGTGFIGKNLVPSLLEEYDVRLLTRDPVDAKRLFPKAEIYKGDITKKDSLRKALKDIDSVVHLAGIVSYSLPREELFRINFKGTKNLLEYCTKIDKFIFSSSVSVYGETRTKATENYRCRPANPYGESKLKAEKAVLQSRIPSVVFRIAPIYGVGSPSWLKNLKLLERGFPIPRTKNLTHIIHITDVVQAFELGLKKGEGVYNIADKEPVRFTEFAEMLVRALGKRPVKMPAWFVNLLAAASGKKTYCLLYTSPSPRD